MSLSVTQINKLGDRVRKSDPVAVEDIMLLQQVRDERIPALDAVMRELRSISLPGIPPLRPTSRPKSIPTTVEKLKRERSRLATIQDLVGARIVLEGGLHVQDRVVEAIRNRFAETEIVDRRSTPSHGYRAVHVIVTHLGSPVEIQVRTSFQDQWAQLFEKLGDLWGRQIRYGEPPNEPEVEVARLIVEGREGSAPLSRLDVLLLREAFSVWVHRQEEVAAPAERILREHKRVPRKLKKRCKKAIVEVENVRGNLRSMLKRLEPLAETSTTETSV